MVLPPHPQQAFFIMRILHVQYSMGSIAYFSGQVNVLGMGQVCATVVTLCCVLVLSVQHVQASVNMLIL